MNIRNLIFILLIVFIISCSSSNQTDSTVALLTQTGRKPRTIVTTDGEVDDRDSFIRLLLYCNEFHLEGLIYSSSQWHYKGDGKGTLFLSEMPFTRRRYGERTDLRWPGTTWIQELIDKYAEVYENLKKHDNSYPSPGYLKSVIKVGNIDFEGDMAADTEGSDFIKQVLLDDKEGPVYVQIWGGTNTLARALKSIEEEYKGTGNWKEIYRKVSDKTFIYAVLDQDATYKKYVEPNWPEIRVIYNSAQFGSFAYMWPQVVPQNMKPYLQGPWFAENILFGHGPLMAAYYTWGDGRQIDGDPEHDHGQIKKTESQGMNQYDFISEGDSPAYFHLIDFGLRSTENPAYGGLGGRFVQSLSNPNRWEDGENVMDYNPATGKKDRSYLQVRWIEVLQNDFAARADWCVADYNDANHAPKVRVDKNYIISAKGEKIQLTGNAVDPDGDEPAYTWWNYVDAGTYPSAVELQSSKSDTELVVPEDAEKGQTIHMILEVSDNGVPSLTRFQRVVIEIQ